MVFRLGFLGKMAGKSSAGADQRTLSLMMGLSTSDLTQFAGKTLSTNRQISVDNFVEIFLKTVFFTNC
jgi:hypothetical protein